jgi:hypothetical protein
MLTLGEMTNARLAKELTLRSVNASLRADAIFALAEHGHERMLDIMRRLGDAHPTVRAYEAARSLCGEAAAEARWRCGPVSFTSLYPTMLMQTPRYVRTKKEAA